LKLKHDKLLSSFAFNINLRQYTSGADGDEMLRDAGTGDTEANVAAAVAVGGTEESSSTSTSSIAQLVMELGPGGLMLG